MYCAALRSVIGTAPFPTSRRGRTFWYPDGHTPPAPLPVGQTACRSVFGGSDPMGMHLHICLQQGTVLRPVQ
eukprot:6712819-Heterocapsa_arctica.AAC.1